MDPLPDIPDAGRFLVERLQVQSERQRESARAHTRYICMYIYIYI